LKFIPQIPIKKFLKLSNYNKISLITSIVIIVFIIIELTGSLINSGNNEFFIDDKNDLNKKVFNSSVIKNFYHGLSSTPYNYLTTFKSDKPDNCFRVFLIGESSLSGWPYSKEQSIDRKLNKLFGHYIENEKIEIITISIAGFNTSLACAIIPNLMEFKPDLIMLYTGHNEFYGYNGYTTIRSKSNLVLMDLMEKLLQKTGVLNSITYDKYRDDLEILLPFNADEQIITESQKEYYNIKNQYLSNIQKIISVCRENKIRLALTALSDNCLLPPIGVLNRKDDISADIIYNNARMALIRDGNQNTAVRLFKKSKDVDAFRLRIPENFIEDLKNISEQNDISIADINTEFTLNSPNNIPGNNLFMDYIHPNSEGLNILASAYAKIILTTFFEKNNYNAAIETTLNNNPVSKKDSVLAQERIERSHALIKLLNNSKYMNEVAVK